MDEHNNMMIISDTNPKMIASILQDSGVNGAHFTNGTYAYKASMIVPTVLAGFQNAMDDEVSGDAALIIAVNSDKSMADIMDAKIVAGTATSSDKDSLEDQNTRAMKVCGPLALQNPSRKVFAVFYDESTPNDIYDSLNAHSVGMESLFKWGYGTGNNTGVIEGAENFKVVYGHPLPNDTKPLCDELTRIDGQAGSITVRDLRIHVGKHGKPYINTKGECLFAMRDPALFSYGVQPSAPQTALGMKFSR